MMGTCMNSVCCVEPWGLPDQVFVCPLGGGGGGVSVTFGEKAQGKSG